ncbi:MAG TPA: nuclear transport factor 2 family protein [Candidatus Tectomicrobia bacterium]|nr:nuclear transport factor 2 family protein [Candidatus Tectomicrobia bacterium]
MTSDESRNLATLERMAAAFDRQDVDAIVDLFADDGVFDTTQGSDPWGERFTGKAAIRTAIERVFKTLPDIRFVDATRWVHGDRGVAEWTCVATTPSGRRMAVRGCDLFAFRDGKVARKDTYFKQVVRPKA